MKVVRDIREWEALEPVWDRLLARIPERTVFQTYDYQRLWWRHFGGDNELFIAVVLRDGAIAGIAPLQIQPVKLYGRSPPARLHRLPLADIAAVAIDRQGTPSRPLRIISGISFSGNWYGP